MNLLPLIGLAVVVVAMKKKPSPAQPKLIPSTVPADTIIKYKTVEDAISPMKEEVPAPPQPIAVPEPKPVIELPVVITPPTPAPVPVAPTPPAPAPIQYYTGPHWTEYDLNDAANKLADAYFKLAGKDFNVRHERLPVPDDIQTLINDAKVKVNTICSDMLLWSKMPNYTSDMFITKLHNASAKDVEEYTAAADYAGGKADEVSKLQWGYYRDTWREEWEWFRERQQNLVKANLFKEAL